MYKILQALQRLAKEQRPSSEFREMCVELAHEVFFVLQAVDDPQVKIDRVFIAGSIGKGTALGDEFYPNTDIIVFVNDIHPLQDKSDILAKFKASLEQSTKLPGFTFEKATQQSLKFLLMKLHKPVIQFDLCVAANMVPDHQARHLSSKAMIREQAENVRSAISNEYRRRGRGYNGFEFSSSLAEQAVELMRIQLIQHEQIMDTAYLAKLWSSKVKDIGYISGRSYIMEVVAIAACDDARRNFHYNVADSFYFFLRIMSRFDTVRIVNGFYDKCAIPSEIFATRGPIIMDPVNPYNNIASGLNSKQVKAFKAFAILVLPRLTKLELCKDEELLFADADQRHADES